MAKCDYYLCDQCQEKCFYDADIPDRFEQAGKIKAICKQCAETHTISIDGKAVAANIDRLDVTGRFGWGEMVKDSEGPYMLFSDHQQALAENVALYAKQVGQALERLTDDFIFRLAEKDHAYQQLRKELERPKHDYRKKFTDAQLSNREYIEGYCSDFHNDLSTQINRAVIAERKCEQQAQQITMLQEALGKLVKEIDGILGIGEEQIRNIVGNTNVNVLHVKIATAQQALKESRHERGS